VWRGVLPIVTSNQQNIDFLFFYGKDSQKAMDFVLDNIQDLFYDLIRTRKSLGETNHIRLYLAKSLRRKLIRELEKKKIEIGGDTDRRFDPEIVFSVEEEMVREENRTKNYQLIREGMQKLSSKQREILYYKFDCGFDYDQICELMSISYDDARQSGCPGRSFPCRSIIDFDFSVICYQQVKKI